ncbi:MAG: MATE family efflux transporter [Bacillota bacterium]|nr:MATE family efflux transporter [Bacillota bacterium]
MRSSVATEITEGVIWRQILRYATPILLSNLLQHGYSTVNLLIVGRHADHAAMAAIGSTGALGMLVTGLFIGLGTGASVVMAQSYGARDHERVHRTVHTSLAMALLGGAFLTLVGILLTPVMLRLLGTPPDVYGGACVYMRIYFAGIIPSLVYNYGSALLRAVGDSRRPLYFLATAAVANILLSWFFVAVCRWGVFGAGLATALAQLLAAVLTVSSLMRANASYRLHPRELAFDAAIVRASLAIGVPSGVQAMLMSLSNAFIQSRINQFGSEAVAGATAANLIDGHLYVLMNAFGLAATTFTGQNIGAGKPGRVRRGTLIVLAMSIATSFLIGLPIGANMMSLLSLFSDDARVLECGLTMLSYYPTLYWLFAIGEVLSGVIRGSGRAQVPMLATLVCMTGFRFAWNLTVLPVVRSFDVLAVSYPLSWMLVAIVMSLYYCFGRWLRTPDGRWLRLRDMRTNT